MTGSKLAATAANAACRKELETLGFRKRAGSIFTCDLDSDTIGWIGLNSAGNRPDGPYEINPVVGVRHQELERIVAELSHQKPHAYQPPTISTPIGYIMPEQSYRAWYFSDAASAPDVAASMAEAIRTHGLPYMRDSVTLDALIEQMRANRGHQLEMRLPVAYQLRGEPDAARALVEEELTKLGDRSDAAAENFRGFAALFVRQYGQAI